MGLIITRFVQQANPRIYEIFISLIFFSYYHMRERRYGSFTRSVTIPTNIKAEDIEASYDAGILTLRLPKTDDVKPKRIPIQAGKQRMLEGTLRDKNGSG
jgi:hypothetical protein